MRISKWIRAITTTAGAIAALTGMVMQEEGNSPKGYLDIAGVATACYGHTQGVRVGVTYTDAQCITWLKTDVGRAWAAVEKYVKVPITLQEHMAYADFIYNLGETNFAQSTLLKKLNRGDHSGACAELLRWNKATVHGVLQPVQGLTDRRQTEYEYCTEGL